MVWQKSIELTVQIYQLTALFPTDERFGLTSQMRRSAVSIASNIAEGSRRNTRKDFRHFIAVAYGSGAELETQLIIANQLKLTKPTDINAAEKLLGEIMKMLNKLLSIFNES